ncbi:MAG: HesA/MoeB/ThiF family protein [Dissulfuribacterales bacterium]
MRYTFTIQQQHYQELKQILIKRDGTESMAIILCGRSFIPSDPWDGFSEERFLSQKILFLPENEIFESKQQSIICESESFIQILKKAERKDLAVAFVRYHPEGQTAFSHINDTYEPEFFKFIFMRNGGIRPHAALALTPDGQLFGRAWDSKLNYHSLDLIRILGEKFKILYPERGKGISAEAFNRQELAFGKALNQDLANLRIAVVGCGGTGSAVALFLARLGVGQILLIDKDVVDETNLNRLHGASLADAEAANQKVSVLASVIEKIGLGTRVKPITEWVESEETINFLKACDLIFGCTDDHQGRLFLNRLSFFYLQPLIDMGLMIKVSENDPPEIKVLDGRVTVIFPGNVCLLCRKIIDTTKAYSENICRNSPDEYKKLKKEAYVIGEGDPSPAVITFTSEVAIMAINEFLQRMQGFRGEKGSATERRRFFIRCEDRKTGAQAREGCDLCGNNNYWGRGDMTPFLNRV